MKPEHVKQWLKEMGKDRAWLARQCHVSKPTVDGWLSNRPIPGPAQAVISQLMAADTRIEPKFTVEEFVSIQKRAHAEGLEIDEWIWKTVRDALDG